jgi:hypothetical protein
MRLSPPKPEVEYLPAIFRRIQNGDIRIPAFQREFVWDEGQVLSLLESLYKGFPIGSILFWRVNTKILKVEAPNRTVFPDIPEKYPLSYILDGLQRMTALYGCFHWVSVNKENIFNVIFDLENEEFVHYRKDKLPEYFIHLSHIFNPKDFMLAQRGLSKSKSADKYFELTVRLHSSFQEYLIPTVTISERAVDEVVEIFERINSTGTKLDAIDFLRAVTWSEDFDLNDALDEITKCAADEGFDIPEETIVKILAMSLNEDPTPEAMLHLRKYNVSDLKRGVDISRVTLTKALKFIKDECLIYSYDFIPYQGQLLIIVKYVMDAGVSFESNIANMKKWFWSISFNEGYRGKPDSYIVRDLKYVGNFVKGHLPALSTKLSLSVDDLSERPFTKGKALSAAFANLFAINNARSLTTGEPIEIENYMSEFSFNNYEGIISLPALRDSIKSKTIRTNRLLANIFLITEDEHRLLKKSSPLDIINNLLKNNSEAEDILLSQLLPMDCIKLLKSKQYEEFLKIRSIYILEKAVVITS